LECVRLDYKAGVVVFARSQYAPGYVEMPQIPGIVSDHPVTALGEVDDLFRRLRSDRERKAPFVAFSDL
jgi:hypothetical protein